MVPNASRLWSAGAGAALIAACSVGSGSGGSAPTSSVTAPDTTGFIRTRMYRTAADDYVRTLDYIANAAANGGDDSGNGITGYTWWSIAYPTLR